MHATSRSFIAAGRQALAMHFLNGCDKEKWPVILWRWVFSGLVTITASDIQYISFKREFLLL